MPVPPAHMHRTAPGTSYQFGDAALTTPTSGELADVALAHDYLTQCGGAERVVLAMLKAFPSAVLYTTLFEPSTTYPGFQQHQVLTSPLNRLGVFRRHHRLSLPLLAPAVSSIQVPARVTICSSSGWSHGVQAAGRKVVFCHAPARWLYQGSRYLGAHNVPAKLALAALRPWLQRWDRKAALSAHRYLAVSTMVSQQIKDAYGIESEVLASPVPLDLSQVSREVPGIEPGFLFIVSRLLPYKNVDLAVQAMSELPDHYLVVVGKGPERERLEREAPLNVKLLGTVTDEELRWLYQNAAAIIAPSFEDFGLTPLEGAMAGKPTIALRAGGYLDTVVEGTTGVFFDGVEPKALRQAIVTALSERWDGPTIQAHASLFSEDRFARRLRQIVADELELLN